MTNKATVTVSYDRDISPAARANLKGRFLDAKSIVDEINKSIVLDGKTFLEHNIMVTDSIQITVRAVQKQRKAHVVQSDTESRQAVEKAKAIILSRVSDKEHFVY